MQSSRKESEKFLSTKSFCAWTTRLDVLVSATAKERLTGDVQNVSRNPLQRRGAAAKRRCALQPAGGFIGRVQGAQVTARQSGYIREDAASQVVASWMETRCPSGPGRDSIAGSVRSMTARPDARSLSSQKGKSDTQRKVNGIKRRGKKLWTGLYRETRHKRTSLKKPESALNLFMNILMIVGRTTKRKYPT